MAEGRTKKAIRNSVVGVTAYILNALAVFFAQRIFVDKLGYDMLGLNYVFLTILGALSLAELGVGTAIVFSLYEPIARGDESKTASLIQLYRKVYAVIGGIILAIGLALIPALPLITKSAYSLTTLLPYYLLFLVNSSLSYLFTYNQTLLNACQRNYVVSSYNAATKIVITLMQIALLFIFSSYLLYLIVMVVFNILASIGLMVYVQKKYPYIVRPAPKISSLEKKGIWKNVSALMYHRIGDYLIDGIDNLVISVMLGTVLVGYYSNYAVLTTTLMMVMINLFAGLTAGLGNLFVMESRQHVQTVFKRINFMGFIISGVFAAGIFVLASQFIELWMGTTDSLQPFLFVLFWVINFFLRAYSEPMMNLRAAAGKFAPDKYLNIFIAILNLGLSIGLVFLVGLPGVLIGTTVCLIIKRIIVVPYIAARDIYGGKAWSYYVRFCYDLLGVAVAATLSYFAFRALPMESGVLRFIVGGFVTVAITVAIMCGMNFCRPEFHYVKGLMSRLLKRSKKANKDLVVKEDSPTEEAEGATKHVQKVLILGDKSSVVSAIMREFVAEHRDCRSAELNAYQSNDLNATRDYVVAYDPDIVIDCSAVLSSERDNDNGTQALLATRNLAQVCGEMDIKVICLSTAEVYCGRGKKPILPSETVKPNSACGAVMRKIEEEYLMYVRKLFIVRTGELFGADADKLFFESVAKQSRLEMPIDASGSPTYVLDLAPFVVFMSVTEKYGTYHCANAGACTKVEFVREYVRLAGLDKEVVGVKVAKKPLNCNLDIQCLTDVGYKNMPTWQDALARFALEMKNAKEKTGETK